MGSFSGIDIDAYNGFANKNGFFHDIVEAIFLPTDYKESQTEEDGDIYVEKVFESKVGYCLDRLKIFGTTLEKAKSDFLLAKEEAEYINLTMSYDDYISFINESIYSGKGQYELEKTHTGIARDLISCDFCIGQPTASWLFSVLQSLNPDSVIKYDLTSVIDSGWVKNDFINELDFKKIIILTEGKTDTKYIKESLALLYPHLKDYYHFMDFCELSLNGGASHLVHTIKSFIGSGINNKIIALFDNDTAGLKEIKNLEKVNIPNNIKIFHYPDIELAEIYPTLGPTGEQCMNINGLACSIEMYLGRDVLLNGSGDYIPIQWTGFEKSMSAYQGVVLEKKQIQEQFEKKIKFQQDNQVVTEDWEEMCKVIDLIKTAWN